MHPRFTRSRALGLLAGAAAAACASPARAQTTRLRMAVVPTDSYALPYYALDRGFFTKAGLDVEIHAFTTGGQITGAVAGNALDVGLADPIQVGDAVNRGIAFKYFAGGTIYTTDAPTTQLCVLQNGAIKSASDLAGKTIGVFGLKSMPQYATRKWLESNGIDVAGVNFVEFPPSAMTAAIQRGTVAAGIISEPFLSAAPKQGVIAFAKVYDACAKQFYINSWFANEAWLHQNDSLVRKLVSAIYDAARWANAHHSESLQILAKYGKIDVVAAASMKRSLFDTSLDPAKVQPPLSLAWEYHGLRKELSAADLMAQV